MTAGQLTGPKVFAITASFFAVIIGVNMVLAYQAVSTFPGLEVANGYVASQTFDDERRAQEALGWTLDVQGARDTLTLRFNGADGLAVQPTGLTASIGRATEAQEDSIPNFAYSAGTFTAPVALNPGKWILRIDAVAPDGTQFRQRVALFVKE
jgi:nitrogen fixation protein FixH